jgi:hypothetical protein
LLGDTHSLLCLIVRKKGLKTIKHKKKPPVFEDNMSDDKEPTEDFENTTDEPNTNETEDFPTLLV